MAQQDAIQNQQQTSSAIAAGAFGGDRAGVAQAALAGQQALANNTTLAGLNSSNYSQALAAAQQQQSVGLGAAQANRTAIQQNAALQAGLGTASASAGTGIANAQLGAGALQQQTAQAADTAAYQQFEQQQAYPFQTAQFYANIAEGIAPNYGSTTTGQSTTETSGLNSILGGGLGLASLFLPSRAAGGAVSSLPYAEAGEGYVPMTGTGGPARMLTGNLNFGQGQQSGQQANQQGLSNLMTGLGQAGKAFYNSPLSNSLNDSIQDATEFGMNRGGKVVSLGAARARRGYDGGGVVGTDGLLFDPNAIGSDSTFLPGVGAQPTPDQIVPPATGLGAATPTPPSNDNSAPLSPIPVAPAPNARAYTGGDGNGLGAAGVTQAPTSGLAAIDSAAPASTDPMGGYSARVRSLESSGDDAAVSSAGATGRYQFMPKTWAGLMQTHPELNLTSDGVTDPRQQEAAMTALTADNASALTKALGRAPTPGELYLAHQQGAGGAIGLLTNPNAPAADIVGSAAVTQNGGTPGMTAGQFAGMWDAKFNGAKPSADGLGSALAYSSDLDGRAASAGLGDAAASSSEGLLGSLGGVGRTLSSFLPAVTDSQRMGLMAAGLGMAASPSKSVGMAIGQGGLQGIKAYQTAQNQSREQMLARASLANTSSEISTRAGQLDLGNRKVDIAAKQFQRQLEQTQQSLKNDSQRVANETDRTKSETQLQRAEVATKLTTPTPQGLMVRDPNNLSAPPKLVPYSSMQGGTGTTGDGTVQPAAAVKPVVDPNGYTHPPAQVKINPMLFSPAGQAAAMKNSDATMDGARSGYEASQGMKVSLDQMQHDLGRLPSTGFLAAGPGQQQRAAVMGQVNSILRGMGVSDDNMPNADAIASSESLKKLTTRMGFDLSKSVGGREPGFIVQQAVGAVPSSENSPMGAQRLIGGLRAVAQRQEDRYKFLTEWGEKSGGDLTGADEAFNSANPPSRYVGQAVLSTVDPRDLAALKSNPKFATAIDKKYGLGTSKYALGS